MARTRTDLERDAKLAQIVDAAERRLRDGGYEALSVAGIARELGLAQNAIYWYFPSKDHLFVAAMESMLQGIVARKPSDDVGRTEKILWFTDRFEGLSNLRGAMNERAQSSPVVAEFVENLDALLSRMLGNTLRGDLGEEELPIAVEALRATIEGTFVKGLDKTSRRRVLRFAIERVVGADAGST